MSDLTRVDIDLGAVIVMIKYHVHYVARNALDSSTTTKITTVIVK